MRWSLLKGERTQCTSSWPPSTDRFLNVLCDLRQLKALAVPPIRNQIPLQTGTSTRLRERDSFVRPIVCPMPSLARPRASHRGVVALVQNAALWPGWAPASHRPASRHGGAQKTQINFKQVRRIPRRVMRKDRNTHAHTHTHIHTSQIRSRTCLRVKIAPLVICPRGSGRFAHRGIEGGVSGQGKGAAQKVDRGGRPTTRPDTLSPALPAHRWTTGALTARGGEALCVHDEASSRQRTLLRVQCASPVKQMPALVTVPTYMDRLAGGLAPIGGCRVVEPPSRL